MDLTNVTLSGNNVTSSGGGIYNGSISTTGVVAQTTLTNVTISNNTAANGGGIFNKAGNTIEHKSLIKNTIIANSTGGNCAGVAVNSIGYNLDDEIFSACGLPQLSTDLSPQDPNLGPLQDNGGPTFTRT